MKTMLLILTALLTITAAANAAIINVPADHRLIQNAISAATDGDTIILANGTYTSVGNRDISFGGRAITVRSQNGPENCIIDCQGTMENPHRGFIFNNGEAEDSVLSGVTIKNGCANFANADGKRGGAILCWGGRPTINNCIIVGNSSEFGAIYGGGAITNCIFKFNAALSGGGLAVCSGQIVNCTFEGNVVSGNGGAMINCSGEIIQCNIIGNRSEKNGGGLAGCSGKIVSSHIIGNSAANGGGLGNCDGLIANCVIAGNYAEGSGGGLEGCEAAITNCTIVRNSSQIFGGGLFECEGIVTNCILWANEPDQFFNTVIPSYSCIQDSNWAINDIINLNPMFNNISGADPLNWDTGLSSNSSCIDTGTNSVLDQIPPTDINGNPRLMIGVCESDAIIDMGASEYKGCESENIYLSVSNIDFISVNWRYGEMPDDQQFKIINTGLNDCSWEASSNADWLTLDKYSGICQPLQTKTIIVSVDVTDLEIGTHHCQLTVDLNSSTSKVINVTLIKQGISGISTYYDELVFRLAEPGSQIIEAYLPIVKAGGASLDFTIEDDSDWLTISPTSGKLHLTHTNVIFQVNPSGLGIGIHECEATISAPEAYNSPIIFKAFLVIGSEMTINVPADLPTIQAAIDVAADGDVIIVADGTYTGKGNRDIDFKGKAINVKSANGPEQCIIDCQGTQNEPHRGFIFKSNETVGSVLDGFTIKGGYTGSSIGSKGGAILCEDSGPVINNCIISGNTARSSGGGVYGSTGLISNCNITSNVVILSGGGGVANCDLLSNCTIASNVAHRHGGGAYGGSFLNCTITNNVANEYGGGVYEVAQMVDCEISYNEAYRGGGIKNYSCDSGNSSLINCNVHHNKAIIGGGIYYFAGEIVDSVIDSNIADRLGGGLMSCTVTISSCRITNNAVTTSDSRYGTGSAIISCNGSISDCVIAGNIASYGAVVRSFGGNISRSLIIDNIASQGFMLTACIGEISNCLIFNNTASSGTLERCSEITNSIIWDNSPAVYSDSKCSFSCIEGSLDGISGQVNFNVAPNFVDAYNADLTKRDFHLTVDSPCIDGGEPSDEFSNEPEPNGGRINIGIYGNTAEAAITVDSDNDGLDNSFESRWGLDPHSTDTDQDGFDDYYEVAYDGNAQDYDPYDPMTGAGTDLNAALADTDMDSLSDGDEINVHYTNPIDSDSDNDGLSDGEELSTYNTDPLDSDTDKDGTIDGWEIENGLDPLDDNDAESDSDSDGLTNLEEYNIGTLANNPDSDSDAMPDGWEVQHNLNPLVNDAADDPDNDQLVNSDEFFADCDPQNPDTDADQMHDGWEYLYGLDPADPGDKNSDKDADGVTNIDEYDLGLNPDNSDTDEDRMPDGWEVLYGLDPLHDDGDEDNDDDGYSNLHEFLAGSNPLDPNSVPQWRLISVDDDAPLDPGPNSKLVSDPLEDGSADHPFDSIEEAMDFAMPGDTVVVAPGTYKENISFNGKAVTLRSTDPTNWDIVNSTIINAKRKGSCITFDHDEGFDSVIEGFTLTNGSGYESWRVSGMRSPSGGGVLCINSSPVIRYCNITRNGFGSGEDPLYVNGSGMALGGNCQATISNCFITNNTTQGRGAAIYICMNNGDNFTPSSIVNCTIADNKMYYGEETQIYLRYSSVNIANTIVYGNVLGINNMEDPSTIINSCINSIASDGYGDDLYDLSVFEGIITENPRFVRSADFYDMEDYGDYHLRTDSPCINAGVPDFETVAKDIDGDPRILGGRIDIGADEVVPKIVATKPFAGEVLVTGSTRIIEWISYVYAGNIDILFTDNNGDTWQTIAADLENSGTYQWHLPDIVDSDQCMIKIIATDYDEPISYFPSDLFTIHPTNPDVDVDLAWPTLGGSNTRTGLSTTNGPELGCIKWQFPTTAAIHQSVTIGADNNVHIPTEDGKLHTLSPDGVLLWTYDAGSEITSPPTVGPDGTVFIGTRNGKLCAIDKNSRVRWTHTIGDMIYAAPTVTEDGTIYVGSTDGNLYAIASDGTSLWTFNLPMIGQIGNSILASPTIGIDGSIYIGGAYSSTLYALDPATGSENWTADWLVGNGFFVSPIVAHDGTVLVFLLENSMLIAIDHNDGTMLFSSEMAGPITEDVLIAHWPFDGNANDMTGSHHGTLRNGAAIDSNGNSALGAGALSLDGIDDYVEIDGYKGVEGAKDRTVSGWIKTTAATAILYWGKPELGREWFIRLNSTGALRLKVNGGKVNGTTPLNDDTWHHFAIVFENDGTPDLSDVKFYVDGQLEDVTFSSELAIDTASHENMTIGYGPSSYFVGLIDDVRIYNWAMTAEEIQPMDMPQDESSWFSVDFTERYPDPKCFTEPAIGPDGTIYVSLDDPYLRAVDPDGTIKWVTRLGMVGGFTLTVTQDGLIYAACDDGTLYVVDSDGNELSRFTGSKWLSFPVIAPDGTIYVSDSGSTLWAINSAPCDNAADLHRPADISADGIVNFTDFSLFAADWLNCTDPGTDNGCDSYSTEIQYYSGDIDHNLYVNLNDLMQIADKWLNSN